MATQQERVNLMPKLPVIRVRTPELISPIGTIKPGAEIGSRRFRNRHGRISKRRILFPFLYLNTNTPDKTDKMPEVK